MCIVLLTTAHPDYALIVIDNRDEFILRPTSRPVWWETVPKAVYQGPKSKKFPDSIPSSASASTAPSVIINTEACSDNPTPLSASPSRESVTPSTLSQSISNQKAADDIDVRLEHSLFPGADSTTESELEKIQVLSARDLQRAERGTWLGITRGGNFAVLTNYREMDTHDALHPIHAPRSRGGMVTAWMCAPSSMSTKEFVADMIRDGGVKGVGGFSLMCGKLRPRRPRSEAEKHQFAKEKEIDPLAIISNRYDHADEVPWVARHRGEFVGLSNACFNDPECWPKIEDGKSMLKQLVHDAEQKIKKGEVQMDEDEVVDRLFAILDRDTLPKTDKGQGLEAILDEFKKSIFIPPVGDEVRVKQMEEAQQKAPAKMTSQSMFQQPTQVGEDDTKDVMGFMNGMYGTQRQTVLLVDWDGNVRFTERALWDAYGRPIKRGGEGGDLTYRFKIEGWDDDKDADGGSGVRSRLA